MTRPGASGLRTATALALLLLTACGAADTAGAGAGDGGTTPSTATGGRSPADDSRDAAAVCLEGASGCDDAPTGTGGPESGPDGSVPVADAVAAEIQGPFLMSGYYLGDGSGARLCESLAESFPPQCGGVSIPLDESGSTVDAPTTTEGDVTWTDAPVAVEGEIVDGVFVVGAP